MSAPRRRYALVAAAALLLAFAGAGAAAPQWAEGCSESLCGPRVSKCILLKSCNCTMAPLPTGNGTAAPACPCCKQCVRCLADYYSDCCACVGLCRPSKRVDASQLMRSLVDDLHGDEGQRALFHMLTDDDGGGGNADEDAEWTVHSFPTLGGGGRLARKEEDAPRAADALGQLAGLNCTVAFVKRCLSLDKCRKACQSMGAASYRWFHTGCCECVGYTCIDYGWREAMCALCDGGGGGERSKRPAADEL